MRTRRDFPGKNHGITSPESASTKASDRHTGQRWVKSSLSYANGDCVEVAGLPEGLIGVRDSKDASSAVLRFTASEWEAFIGGVKNGEFDAHTL